MDMRSDNNPVRGATDIVVSARWLALATIGPDGLPQASYAPFAPLATGLGIVVSGLAAHTRNLLDRPAASVLIVFGEPLDDGDFARPRLSIDVRARPLAPASADATRVWTALDARQGAVAQMLRALPDFIAFMLEPVRSRLILGFAAAHDLDAARTREHLEQAQGA